ncbi:homing endonuclease associated repeat-containing protein [Halorussus caseinilyticus]|uniref:Homing endonuclease associated repeat-containing protein n=1 Tax=Halorussus caseinilyticus TaxID=3034025 RepID=A0ABD5WNQ8_9EURY|nr:hypothetical protein [Halorussus sp. DT72]
MSQQVSPETLRSALQSLAARLGKTPTVVDMYEEGQYAPKRYQEVFGGWNEALESAGLDPEEMGSKRIPDRELLAELQRLYTELGKPPTQRDMTERGQYSNRTYQLRFGSWSNALQEAMLDTNDGISETELLREIERLADELGRAPKAAEMDERGEYAPVTYHRRFGSWREALTEANLDGSRQNVSEEELLADLRNLADELGEAPTTEDVRERGDYSLRTYYDRFDSFSAAREQALSERSDR